MKRTTTAITLSLALAGPAVADINVTVAMTADNISISTGIPDQASEGVCFGGYSLYDAPVLFDLSHSDKACDIRPGLATSWHIDPANPRRWIFKLRDGVKWQDGCPFVADDVVWNFQRILNKDAPQFDAFQFVLGRTYAGNVASVEKIDDHTVAIVMGCVHSLFLYLLPQIMQIRPCNAERLQFDCNALAFAPSGTGPYRYHRMVALGRLELDANRDY
jgi:peptide/nickel transport system substrate-binding protein